MLEGYKPIDFGNLFASQPVDLGQVRNRVGVSQAALNILANSEFNQTPISTFLANGLNSKGETPKRKQTLWGRVVDFLSFPAYAVANAADDALAGHQSSDTDSVLKDTGQVIGGIVTGAGRGIGTGMRGAFASSETAADPMDKQYLGDFLIRWDTHMSAEDAMKPENREEVKRRLAEKKINMLSDDDKDKYFYDWDKGKVDVSDEDVDQYFKDMQLYGLGASFVSDPLNFVKGPTGIFKGKGGAEVPELISGSKNTYEGFKSLPEGAVTNSPEFKLPVMGKAKGSYKVPITPGVIQNKIANPATGELITPPDWFTFPANANAMGGATRTTRSVPPVANVTDDLDAIINPGFTGESWASKLENPIGGKRLDTGPTVAEVSKNQTRIVREYSNPKNISRFAGDLLKRAATGNFANAVERLSTKHPGIEFTNTARTLERFSEIPDFTRRLGNESERRKIFNALGRAINADVKILAEPKIIQPAEDIINQASEVGPVALDRLVEGARPTVKSRNPTRDAEAVTNVVEKFKDQILGTATPSGLRDPAKWTAAVNAGKNVRYSGPQQVQMWNYITSVLLKNVKTPNRFAKANSLLRQAEDYFLAQKATPMSSFKKKGSVPLRLSQVLDAIGPAAAAMDRTLLTAILRGDKDALAKLPVATVQKIEEFKAGEAIVDATNTVKGIDATKSTIEDLIKGPLSAARQEEIVTIGSAVADDIARMAGGSPVAGSKAGAAIKDSIIPKAPGDGFPATNTTALISHPDVSSNLLKKYSSRPSIDRAIAKAIDSPPPSRLGKLIEATGARVPEWLGARFNAAYKNADMRPTYLREAATAKATVALRAQNLNNLAKRYDINDADLWNDALKGAQGRLSPTPGTQADELSKEILRTMENLFGSSGLKASVALENSVAGRAQLFMKELNANLKRFGLGEYQFTKKGDYSKGTSWLNSWESWDIKKPLEFLFKMQNVVEHTTREKLMFDDLISRFGSKVKGSEFTHTVDSHPRLKGYYFGPRAAEQVEQFVKNLKDISHPSSKAMQNFDKVLSKWKAGVTIYIPSHHIRNMIGDLYFNWLAGVNSTRPYGSALKVMQSQRDKYEGLKWQGLEGIDKLTDPQALTKLATGKMSSTPKGSQIALTMRNGQHITNDMVYIGAFQEGILPTTRVLEDIPDDVATGMEKIKPLGGRGQKAAHTLSEGRDHYVRLAHYIHELKKSPKSFENASRDAAAVVRKWHPDGMDLTKFERNIMRRMFPFYSWTRKAFPLIVESLVATPGKAMVYPKGQYLLQNALGVQTGPMSDPFPYDQLFPDWIREKGIGPIMGGPGSYTVVNPSNPTMDIFAQLQNPGKSAMGMINPAARIPFELSSGTEVQTGAPLEGRTQDYLIKQIPGLSHAGRATGEFGVSETTKENSQGYNFQNIANMLTALGIQNTGPYIKSAEFDLRDYIRSLNGR